MIADRLGNYEIIAEVGRGGMGIVYRARDVRLERVVALKELILPPTIAATEKAEVIERFRREGRTAANLSHANIVTVYDVGEQSDRHYIAMEFLEGVPLTDRMQGPGKLPMIDMMGIICQVAEGLAYAHRNGIVHRDIKPDNIVILKSGQVKITDFGIARKVGQMSSMTQTGTMLGTLGYISPEQLHDSKSVDGRADLFSFGAVIYEIFTGKLPFDGGSVGGTILKIMTEEPVPPSKLNPDTPIFVEKIILKALQKVPDQRYQSAEEMLSALQAAERLMAGEAPTSAPVNKRLCSNCHSQIEAKLRFCPHCGSLQNQGTAAPPAASAAPSIIAFPETPQPSQPSQPAVPSLPLTPTGRMTAAQKSPLPASPKSVDAFFANPSGRVEEPQVKFVRVFGRAGTSKGQFASPRGIYLSPQGFLYVADTQNQRVQVFDRFGAWQFMIQSGVGVSLQSPCGVSVDSTGRIYVVDSLEAKVRAFDDSGKPVSVFGSKGAARDQFTTLSAIAISAQDFIYLVDTDAYRIQVFDRGGHLHRIFGRHGNKAGEFKSPYAIALDEHGKCYVIDYGIPRVQVMDKEGISRLTFGQRGNDNGEFSIPRGIAVDQHGHIFVADTLNHRIQIFKNDGAWLHTFGKKGSGEGSFLGPEAITVSQDGEIFVLDKGNNRVQVFSYQMPL